MKKIIYTMSVALVGLLAASCDKSEEIAPWTPAEPTDAAGIYFTTTDNMLAVTAGEDTHVSIPVCRISNEGELTVPVVAEKGHPDLVVPESVTFADGKYQSEIVIDLGKLPTKELFDLVITFPEEFISPYAAGSATFEGSVIVSDWESVTKEGTVKVQWADWSYNPSNIFDSFDQVMENLPGTNRYRILDFLGTGYDFNFEIVPSEYANWVGYYRIVPLGNQVLYSEYAYQGSYNAWWFTSDDLQEWPSVELTSGGNPVTLYGSSFMWYDDEYGNEYCYMRHAGDVDVYGNVAKQNILYMAYYAFYGEDWDWSNFTGYIFLYIEYPAE